MLMRGKSAKQNELNIVVLSILFKLARPVGFQIFVAVRVRIVFFCADVSRNLVGVFKRFRGTYCLNQGNFIIIILLGT